MRAGARAGYFGLLLVHTRLHEEPVISFLFALRRKLEPARTTPTGCSAPTPPGGRVPCHGTSAACIRTRYQSTMVRGLGDARIFGHHLRRGGPSSMHSFPLSDSRWKRQYVRPSGYRTTCMNKTSRPIS
ncbi:hypothetical protein LX32DRAFT_298863 [Colletotrichum zoysiae]|uniref:Uncharacterized protein n=1 Tax=Colletotrichum zoysiae TaxID=1216348 RepID=A0AAD9H1H2_9PEZI|nr:hypothetical protein LX32DRAFT_298863 [Colletotrichum zoysiae]